MRVILTSVVLAALTFSTGCTKPPPPPPPAESPPTSVEQEFTVNSVPSGATATFSTGEKCTTPCTTTRLSGKSFSVTVSKADYKSATVKVTSNLQSLLEYNRRTGATEEALKKLKLPQEKLTPNPVTVTLDPEWTR